MGLFDILFGSKNRSSAELRTIKSNAKPLLSWVTDDVISVDSLGLIGLSAKSYSGEWVVVWESESRKAGKERGNCVLINTVSNKVAASVQLNRPSAGHVADGGSFAMEDWSESTQLSGTFYVFSNSGRELIKRRLQANILNSAISAGGSLAIVQTCSNDNSVDGNRLIAFDVVNKTELFSIEPIRWPDTYEFDETACHFIVVFNGIGKFRYDKNGEFIDAKQYKQACLTSTRFEVVILAAEDALKQAATTEENVHEILVSLHRVMATGADLDKAWKAIALKTQGLAWDRLGMKTDALSAFDQALAINPKIGVKRRADALRKALSR